MDFAIKIIKLCENVKGHYSLVNQLERSAASVSANIHEANYAHGKPDFIAKKLKITHNAQKRRVELNVLLVFLSY